MILPTGSCWDQTLSGRWSNSTAGTSRIPAGRRLEGSGVRTSAGLASCQRRWPEKYAIPTHCATLIDRNRRSDLDQRGHCAFSCCSCAARQHSSPQQWTMQSIASSLRASSPGEQGPEYLNIEHSSVPTRCSPKQARIPTEERRSSVAPARPALLADPASGTGDSWLRQRPPTRFSHATAFCPRKVNFESFTGNTPCTALGLVAPMLAP